MQSSVFSDPDVNDLQMASQWLIRRSTDSVVVLDSGTDTIDKTNFPVASGVLDYGASYNWQVRYQDLQGAWSAYSTAMGFSTRAPDLGIIGQDGTIVLFWPTNTSGFALEWTTNLSAADWLPASPAPTIIGNQNVVTNVPANDSQFFRLNKP